MKRLNGFVFDWRSRARIENNNNGIPRDAGSIYITHKFHVPMPLAGKA